MKKILVVILFLLFLTCTAPPTILKYQVEHLSITQQLEEANNKISKIKNLLNTMFTENIQLIEFTKKLEQERKRLQMLLKFERKRFKKVGCIRIARR